MSDTECFVWRERHRARFIAYEAAEGGLTAATGEEAAAGQAYEDSVAHRGTVETDLAAAQRAHNLATDDYARASGPAETVAAGAVLAVAKAKVEWEESRLSQAESAIKSRIREHAEAGTALKTAQGSRDAAMKAVEEAVDMINLHCA